MNISINDKNTLKINSYTILKSGSFNLPHTTILKSFNYWQNICERLFRSNYQYSYDKNKVYCSVMQKLTSMRVNVPTIRLSMLSTILECVIAYWLFDFMSVRIYYGFWTLAEKYGTYRSCLDAKNVTFLNHYNPFYWDSL